MSRPARKTKQNRSSFSPTILRKLEDAFSYGFNNKKACYLAGISESVFYDVTRRNSELSERFKHLKESPKITATKNIVDRINKGDVKLSQWYLERKSKEEFATRDVSGCQHDKDPVIDFGAEGNKRVAYWNPSFAKKRAKSNTRKSTQTQVK